jgi:hypothetical protein
MQRQIFISAAAAALFTCACSSQSGLTPARTTSAISPVDVKLREYVIADDSMQGRAAGGVGNVMMTNYIAREMQRLGLEPGGENGTYFQKIPMAQRYTDSASTIAVGGEPLTLFTDFSLIRPSTSVRFATSLPSGTYQTIYGGRVGDTTALLNANDVKGRVIVFSAPLGSNGQPTAVVNVPAGWSISRYPDAAAIMIATTDLMTTGQQAQARGRSGGISGPSALVHTPLGISISNRAAEKIMGSPLSSATLGARGKDVAIDVRFGETPTPYPARNVIAIIRGSDPVLRDEYVQVSAHSDHLASSSRAVDHDSLKAYNMVMRPAGSDPRVGVSNTQTSAQTLRIQAIRDSLGKLHPPRRDSIYNGADDDGSGSTALLEIAENLASAPRPKRSIIIVWHTAEEAGLLGSWWLSEHTTVPHDSIIAVLNMDMVGRGERSDNVIGGPRHLEVIGSRRLSTDLGDVVDSVNAKESPGFDIDYSFDAKGQVQNRYCRSDHYMYARTGIPIAYISRGYHPDYHMVTDEPQYISYTGVAHVAQLVRDVAVSLADRGDRVRVDKPRPDPLAPCIQ